MRSRRRYCFNALPLATSDHWARAGCSTTSPLRFRSRTPSPTEAGRVDRTPYRPAKNNSSKMRTRPSLIPTSSFQTARTNFIAIASIQSRHSLAQEDARGQTFSTDALAANRDWHGCSGQYFATPKPRSLAARAARDVRARVAADARQSDAADDPGNRHPADGPPGRDPACRGHAGAQPDFHLQYLPARADHRLRADDGDRPRAALQRGARRPADVPRGTVADRNRDRALLADPLARRRFHARVRPGAGARGTRTD